MGRSLEILLVESERGASQAVADELEEAGHRVHRCRERGQPVFPCRGLDGASECPLDAVPIDVAVTVRGVPRSQPTVLEDGLVCALKQHVPVVVTGRTALHPFDGHAAETVRVGEVVASVERVARTEQPEHQAAARRAFDVALEQRGLPAGTGAVRIERRDHGLRVTIDLPMALEPRDYSVIATRVMGALRQIDGSASFIDVSVGRKEVGDGDGAREEAALSGLPDV